MRSREAGERARGATMLRHARAVRAPRQDAAVRGRDRSRPVSRASSSRCAIRVAIARGGAERLRAAGIRSRHRRRGVTQRSSSTRRSSTRTRRDSSVGHAQARAVGDGAIADPTRRASVDHGRASRDARCIVCARMSTRSPSASERCSPTIPRSRCASARAARRAARVVFDSTLRTPLDRRCSCARRARSRRRSWLASRIARADADRATLEARARAVCAGIDLRDASTALAASATCDRCSSKAGRGSPGALLARIAWSTASLSFGHRSCLARSAPQAFGLRPPGFEAVARIARVVERRAFGDDTMTTYALHEIPCSPD